jgi:hypothetical protein
MAATSLLRPNGRRVSGERGAEGDERVRCTHMLGAGILARRSDLPTIAPFSPLENLANPQSQELVKPENTSAHQETDPNEVTDWMSPHVHRVEPRGLLCKVPLLPHLTPSRIDTVGSQAQQNDHAACGQKSGFRSRIHAALCPLPAPNAGVQRTHTAACVGGCGAAAVAVRCNDSLGALLNPMARKPYCRSTNAFRS